MATSGRAGFDEELLAILNSEDQAQVSESDLKRIWDALDKVPLSENIDYIVLQKLFKRLQNSLGEDILTALTTEQFFSLLAKVYDSLLLRDFGRLDVQKSILQLLFLLEDLSEYEQGKMTGGNFFVARLFTLGCTKVPSVKLQRAAVETLCAFVTRSSPNQQIFLEDTMDRIKLFKEVLPQCGDFWIQASIVEILFRVSRRKPQLLDLLEGGTLSETMLSVHQMKKPDLIVEIRNIINMFNQSLGNKRSVYSFLAEDIIVDGQSMFFEQEKWVHFGNDHLSFYGVLESCPLSQEYFDCSKLQIIDVPYNDVFEIVESSTHSLELLIQNPTESKALAQDCLSKNFRLMFSFKKEDLSTVMLHIYPRVISPKHGKQKVILSQSNSHNTSTPSGLSLKSGGGFQKASVGFIVPLPKKARVMPPPAGILERATINGLGCQMLQPKDRIKEPLECKAVDSRLAPTGPEEPEITWKAVFTSQKSEPADGKKYILHSDQHKLINKHILSVVQSTTGSSKKSGEAPDHRNEPETKDQTLLITAILQEEKGTMGDSVKEMENHNHVRFSGLKSDSGEKMWQEKTLPSIQNKQDGKPHEAIANIDDILSGSKKWLKKYRKEVRQSNTLEGNSTPSTDAIVISSPKVIYDNSVPPKKNQQMECPQIKAIGSLTEREMKKKNSSSQIEDKQNSTNIQNEKLRQKIRSIVNQANSSSPSDQVQPKAQRTVISDPIETDSEHHNLATKQANQVGTKRKRGVPKRIRHGGKQIIHFKDQIISVKLREKVARVEEQEEAQNTDFVEKTPPPVPVDVFKYVTPFQTGKMLSTPDYRLEKTDYTKRNRRERKSEDFSSIDKQKAISTKILISESPEDKYASMVSKLESDKEPSAEFLPKLLCEDEDDAGDAYNIFSGTVCMDPYKEKGDAPDYSKDINLDVSKYGLRISRADHEKEDQGFYSSKAVKANDIQVDYGSSQDPFIHNNILPEDDGALDFISNDDDPSMDGSIKLLASLVQKLRKKVKIESVAKMSQILTDTSETIRARVREVETQIQTDVDEYIKLCKCKFGQVQVQLRDEHHKLKDVFEIFQKELTQHKQLFNEISSQMETAQNELRSIADRQKMAHKKLFVSTQKFTEQHLIDAEQKLFAVQKAARNMQGLRDALNGILQGV